MKLYAAIAVAAGLGLLAPSASAQTASALVASLRGTNFTPLISLQVHYTFLAAVERCSGAGWACSADDIDWLRTRMADQFAAVAEAQRDMIWGLVSRDPHQLLVMDESRCANHLEAAAEVFPDRFTIGTPAS